MQISIFQLVTVAEQIGLNYNLTLIYSTTKSVFILGRAIVGMMLIFSRSQTKSDLMGDSPASKIREGNALSYCLSFECCKYLCFE